jgi:hypothetical protein
MRALRKIRIEETGYRPETGLAGVPPTKAPVIAIRPAAATAGHLKKVALFFAAPFIGLVYAVLFPFVGLGYLAVLAARAFAARYGKVPAVKAARTVALLIAAPFIGLAYIVAMPFFGAAALAWVGAKALTAK